MIVLTQVELDALVDACETAARIVRNRRESKATAELLMLAADRLRAYPLPAAEGERAELIRALEREAGVAAGRDYPGWAEYMRRAAALLWAPAGGVSVEAVLREIDSFKGGGPQVEELKHILSTAVRALPEAKPLKPYGYGIVDADGDIYLDEVCVADDPRELQEKVAESNEEGEGLRVVQLFWAPMPELEAAKPAVAED